MNLIDHNDYKCGIINKINLSENIINEFKKNYIHAEMWTDDYYNNLLIKNFNKLFVMVLFLTNDNKDKIIKILSNELLESLNNNGGLIVGFIKIENSKKYIIQNKNIWYIDVIDTRISKQNISRIMIYKLKILKKRNFLPLIIAKKSIFYWLKYLQIEYGLYMQYDIEQFIKNNNISKYNNWSILFNQNQI